MTLTLLPIKIPASADLAEIAADLRTRFDRCEFRHCTPGTRAALLAHIRALAALVDDVEALEWAVANPEPEPPASAPVLRLPPRLRLVGSDCHRRPEYEPAPGPEAA